MTEQGLSSPRLPLADRSAWLVSFGCLEIGMGALLLLFVPLVLVAAMMSEAAVAEGPRLNPKMVLPSVGLYLLLAAFFLWVGVGTVRKRRWARTLMLSVSWLWLAVGVFGVVFWFAVILPGFGNASLAQRGLEGQELPARVVEIVITILMTFLYVVLPVVFILFLRSASVRATVERHDPQPRWTDRCPGPVLSMVLTLAYGVVMFLFMLPWSVVPFFGLVLRGFPAELVLTISAGLLVWLTYGFYRLWPAAWWGTLVLTALWTVSALLTFLRVPAEEIYRSAGIDADQLEMMRDMGLGGSGIMIALTALSAVTVVAYLIYLWKYFGRRAPEAPVAAPSEIDGPPGGGVASAPP